MQSNLLLGVEAIAQGAIDAGISGVYAYPGTPSTEITEYIQENKTAFAKNLHSQWSSNEKTAYEEALGMSYCGKRALVCMKHVGLNVAADPFMNSAVTGINGGLVITVADDPSMHSSQNEQDSRYYGKFAMIPVFEPSNQQEAYDMVIAAFEFSEKTALPVMVRITTRLAHSRAGITRKEEKGENSLHLPSNLKQFMLLPAFGRRWYQNLLNKQTELQKAADESEFNHYTDGHDKSLGIVCCGISINYLNENFISAPCPYPVVKISQYPAPAKMLQRLEKECEQLLVIEEGYPLVEESIADFFGNGKKVKGRLDGTLPRSGEMNADHVARALGFKVADGFQIPGIVKNRPPALCQGCGHQDVYFAMNEVIEEYGKGHVFSDIGCYSLGALPPYDTIDTCVDMGASVTMAKGAADAGLFPAFAVIGDSTFTHSGITGLLDAVNEKSDINVIIVDNEAVAMTGGQDSSAMGRLEEICQGVGVDEKHIRVVVPLKKNHQEIVDILKEEIAFKGVSVLIARRPCIQKATRERKRKNKNSNE
jgi:indolepyruvate ferredoxin oxidoreductase alpha subunit